MTQENNINSDELFIQPEYLKANESNSSEVDLYTSLSIFVSKIPKMISSMHDAIDCEDIELLKKLTSKFNLHCESAALKKLFEKSQQLLKTIENCGLTEIRKAFEELSQMCDQMTLCNPETVSMLVRINEKRKKQLLADPA